MSERPDLQRLATANGILDSYHDNEGQLRPTMDATREALLATMGIDASTEAEAASAVAALEAESSRHFLDRVRVVWVGSSDHHRFWQPIHAPILRDHAAVDWRATVIDDDTGEIRTASGRLSGDSEHCGVELEPLTGREIGYYRLRIELEAGSETVADDQLVIVAPVRCTDAAERLRGGAGIGLWTNLYTLRSDRNFGIGDLTDLSRIARTAGELGLSFVGINPVHAQSNEDGGISPYFPVSRLFMNPIYLDVTAVPEFVESVDARRMCSDDAFTGRAEGFRAAGHLDHAGLWAAKLEILGELYRCFDRREAAAPSERGEEYARFCHAHGEALDDFATYVALATEPDLVGRAGWNWPEWPVAYRRPRTEEVRRFRAAHPDRVGLQRYLQFETDRQMRLAEADAEAAGLSVGIYRDLAVGIPEASADVWGHQHLFGRGATVGAPPDAFTDQGQDWGLVPLIPRALRAEGYAYWRRLLRGVLRRGGALRIDHAMGLERQYWVPSGVSAKAGGYVAYPREELSAVLTVESVRRQTVIIAEDLGVVPWGFRDWLAERGMLRSHVFYFERDGARFREPHEYSRDALATANTHDLPPLAGFWSGEDLLLRRRIGHIHDDEELDRRLAERDHDRHALIDCLRRCGIVGHDWWPHDAEALCEPVARFLARTPSLLAGLSLDDLASEFEAVNLPGATVAEHPSWTRRMSKEYDTVLADDRIRALLGELVSGRSR